MEKNVGRNEKSIRIVVGSLLLLVGIGGYAGLFSVATGLLPQALTSIILVLVGIILLATGLLEKCPLNTVFGRNSYEE
ncbi:MAG: DUF2892 domain-containing protein [Candidatus Nanohaloarchaea archaeon]